MDDLKTKNEEYWKDKLTPKQYDVLRKGGTEASFSGSLLHNKDKGVYTCAACGQELFSSDTKFDSGSGWPSFFDVIDPERIELKEDMSYGMVRTEVRCVKCGSHLGHLFNDGPKPTEKRFCINSLSLEFDKR